MEETDTESVRRERRYAPSAQHAAAKDVDPH
jgi:hypothetical protein